MLGSFVSSMPVTGSFSRSAVNHASGVRTPIGGLYTGIVKSKNLMMKVKCFEIMITRVDNSKCTFQEF